MGTKVKLSKLIELVKDKNNKYRLKFYKEGKYYKQMVGATKSIFLFPEEINADNKLEMLSNNIIDNIAIGYEENNKCTFYIVANSVEKEYIENLSKKITNIIKVENITYILSLDKYIIKYSLIKDMELETIDKDLVKLIYENI